MITAVTACRSCGSRRLTAVFSLGSLHMSNFPDAETVDGDPVPLELVLCGADGAECQLLQLKYTTPAASLYRQYWYRSGVNVTMRAALADIAHKAERFTRPRPGDLVLDIGCNDGTLFLGEFIERETSYLKAGGRFLVPLPHRRSSR